MREERAEVPLLPTARSQCSADVQALRGEEEGRDREGHKDDENIYCVQLFVPMDRSWKCS